MPQVKYAITKQIFDEPVITLGDNGGGDEEFVLSNSARALVEQEKTWQDKLKVMRQMLQGLATWAGDATSDLEVDVKDGISSGTDLHQELLMMTAVYHATYSAFRATEALSHYLDTAAKQRKAKVTK